MSATRRTLLGLAVAAPAVMAVGTAHAKGGEDRLTNVAHLRFLLDEVPLPPMNHHSTYDQEDRPTGLAPWTYADNDGGTFIPVGGGDLDPETGHYTQGAYNADDISRCAVVFLRHWRATDDEGSLEQATELLRTLAYLQNDSGPDAGRVVLWQQADGELNPSAEPIELPDPSDSAESYWLARTVWAFGEGYAALSDIDPDFAGFLRERLLLALDALTLESLGRAGETVLSDGVELPADLIAGGADATAEALLGLVAAHETDPEEERITGALEVYAAAVGRMATEIPAWPFGAVLPWTGSRGFWHAWGGAAPEALARAAEVLDEPRLLEAAVADAGSFTPLLLASGGPYNAWSPVPGESQIAYGAHGRVAGPLAAAEAVGEPGLREIAGLAAGWFFGANPAGETAYDPATGVTVDGIEPDGTVNYNSGAESTIHALLTMLLLDENPDLAALATSIVGVEGHRGLSVVEAEDAESSPGCTVEEPDSGAWIGEGNLSGGAFVHVPEGEWVEFDLPDAAGARLYPIVWQREEEAGQANWEVVDGMELGAVDAGGVGDKGLTEEPGALLPLALDEPLPEGPVRVRCTSTGDLRLDALLIRPAVVTAHYRTTGGDAVLYANSGRKPVKHARLADGEGRAYAVTGADRGSATAGSRVRLPGGGFAVTR